MTNPPLPDADHFSRYCKPSDVENGAPLSTAFQLRENEPYLSVNWLEFFGEKNQKSAVAQVRKAFQRKSYTLKANGRFAVLNVNAAKQAVKEHTRITLRIEHMPESDDESHSGIHGYTQEDLTVAIELAALVALGSVYPAVA